MNYHKTHRKKQFLAMFLTGSLMLSGIPVYAAQDTDMDLSVDTTESDDDFSVSSSDDTNLTVDFDDPETAPDTFEIPDSNSDTLTDFSSENASGSTSQAANLIEAVEAGAGLLLLDEDTSATNFMIRDKVMARLVSDEKEPITTLLRHIRGIYRTLGISFVIVVGSSGDYLSVADFVLQMDHYKVKDVTKEAKSICEECGIAGQYPENEITVPAFSRKLKPVKPGRRKIKSMGTDTVLIDREAIDVRYLEQLSENGQTTALAHMMSWILDNVKAEEDIQHIIERMYTIIEKRGMEAIIPASCSGGHPVLPRKQELYACLSRYRSAKIVR